MLSRNALCDPRIMGRPSHVGLKLADWWTQGLAQADKGELEGQAPSQLAYADTASSANRLVFSRASSPSLYIVLLVTSSPEPLYVLVSIPYTQLHLTSVLQLQA